MSLPLEFRAASGDAFSFSPLSTPDSRGLGARLLHKHEVSSPPSRTLAAPRDKLSPVQSPSSTQSIPTKSTQQSARHLSRRHLLPPAMTDLKLWMYRDLLPFTPFYYFVAPEPLPFEGPKLFHRFMDLPLEIHRMIFQPCDTPTLFHLMHTSSYTRRECSELFWEPEPNTWYLPDDTHLLFADGNFRIYHCLEFASHVTQVEINFEHVGLNWPTFNGQAFWDNLQSLFPSVWNVVLSGGDSKRSLPTDCGGV